MWHSVTLIVNISQLWRIYPAWIPVCSSSGNHATVDALAWGTNTPLERASVCLQNERHIQLNDWFLEGRWRKITENVELSWWQICHYWWHQGLSLSQPLLPLVIIKFKMAYPQLFCVHGIYLSLTHWGLLTFDHIMDLVQDWFTLWPVGWWHHIII